MNDNYLWDRTGEPDAEVQELEELLGSLRYQPRPLQIPATMTIRRHRSFIPLAIAAAIALLVIGAGLWFQFANSNPGRTEQARDLQPAAAPSPEPQPESEYVAIKTESQIETPSPMKHRKVNQTMAIYRPRRSMETSVPVLTEAELAQKEQVLVALRLVSAKLNLAQRKAQGSPQINSIRNHKIG